MDVTLREMDPTLRAELLARMLDDYVAQLVERGVDEEQARARARGQHEAAFPPDGSATAHRMFAILADGAAAGHLWMGPDGSGRDDAWFVWSIEVDQAFQHRGIGRRAMQLGEDYARERGADQIGLNVMGDNAAALALYESLGYSTTVLAMRKALGADLTSP